MYVPERRGHGHTADVDGPITYELMAQDTVAYLERAVVAPAHLVGWSDGAVVGMLVALRRPELVRRTVLIGQYYNSTGRIPDSELSEFLATPEAKAFLRRGYDPLTPDGSDHFDVVYDKLLVMFENEPELALDELRTVAAPCLIVQGDRDEVRLDHSQAVVAALQQGRLAVLPGTHALPLESPQIVNPLIISWLRGGPQGPDWGLG